MKLNFIKLKMLFTYICSSCNKYINQETNKIMGLYFMVNGLLQKQWHKYEEKLVTD